MSNYIWGPTRSYRDYLEDISSTVRQVGPRVSMEVTRQTRSIIASNEALARDNIRVMQASTDRVSTTVQQGFEHLSYDLQDISYGLQDLSSQVAELNATFEWGFGAIIVELGHINDALSTLIQAVKTPVQTVALNHFEIARDAFRQGLYRECLEELEKAINGDHTSPGYKLEWRFHHMMGMLRLGFAGSDLALMDLAQAEESFLTAARYAKTDYPQDTGRALLSAGWAAYCQGKLKDALAYTEQAIAMHPGLGQAMFQAAKIHMALEEVDAAFPLLSRAIDLDHRYALKAAADGDCQKYEARLQTFLEDLRQEKYRQYASQVRSVMENIKHRWEGQQSLFAGAVRKNPDIERIETLLTTGAQLPLFDMLAMMRDISASIEAIGRVEEESVSKLIDAKAALENIRRWRENQRSLFSATIRRSDDTERTEALMVQGAQLPSQELLALVGNVSASIKEMNRVEEESVSKLIQGRNEPLGKYRAMTSESSDDIFTKAVGWGFLTALVMEIIVFNILFSTFDWSPKRFGPTRVLQILPGHNLELSYKSTKEIYYHNSSENIKVVSENKDSICVQSRY